MRGGPGRVLPSVIVGGLLMGGLALGTGAASAATCTQGEKTYEIGSSADVVPSSTGSCELTTEGLAKGLTAALSSLTPVATNPSSSTPGTTPADTNPVDTNLPGANLPGTTPVASGSGEPKAGGGSKGKPHGNHVPSGNSQSTVKTGLRNTTAPVVLAPAPLPGAVAAAPPAALPGLPVAPGLGLPALGGAFAPAALAGGSLPGGLSSSLFGANFGNPALLAGTPLGAAATSLYQPQADSAVTTVSHSEALAAGAQRGIGTPTAIAAIALAGVVGILVRSRVLRRIARREPVGAYPFEEALEVDSAAVEPAPADDVVAEARPLMAA